MTPVEITALVDEEMNHPCLGERPFPAGLWRLLDLVRYDEARGKGYAGESAAEEGQKRLLYHPNITPFYLIGSLSSYPEVLGRLATWTLLVFRWPRLELSRQKSLRVL